MRHVKGSLFVDYVRMIRGHKTIDWSRHLSPEDLAYLHQRIEPGAWYPMDSFERMGNAILTEVAGGNLEAVRHWGRLSVELLRAQHPALVASGDPVESLNRFKVLRGTFFDFDALELPMLYDDEARIVIAYQMGARAEEAASFQAMGFFERVLELSGCANVTARFVERSWAGDPRTLLDLSWRMVAGR